VRKHVKIVAIAVAAFSNDDKGNELCKKCVEVFQSDPDFTVWVEEFEINDWKE